MCQQCRYLECHLALHGLRGGHGGPHRPRLPITHLKQQPLFSVAVCKFEGQLLAVQNIYLYKNGFTNTELVICVIPK
jgi:hypothetical protein